MFFPVVNRIWGYESSTKVPEIPPRIHKNFDTSLQLINLQKTNGYQILKFVKKDL